MNEILNEKIGAWLLKEGNSRTSLAEAIGISRPALGKKLSGASKWTWEEVIRLSRVLDCSLNELAGINAA